jgi:hypothetical protein
MLFANLVALHGERLDFVANKKTRAFIKANDRVEWIIGLSIQPEEALHLGQELRVNLPDAPGLLEMRLQLVFFRILPTWVYEMRSQ